MNFQAALRKKIPCVSIGESDIDDCVLDLEEDPATQEAYAKLYDRADVTVYDSYLLTKTAFNKLLQLISVHLPASATKECSQDKYIFFKIYS